MWIGIRLDDSYRFFKFPEFVDVILMQFPEAINKFLHSSDFVWTSPRDVHLRWLYWLPLVGNTSI